MPTDVARPPGVPGASDEPPALPSDSKLARLLETETRLERSIADARRRAEALLEEARATARTRRAEVEGGLEERAGTLRRRMEAETDAAIEGIREEAARRARAFHAADAETVDALAASIVEELFTGSGSDP